MTWTNFAIHWKSTAKGFLIFIITTCGVFTSANIFNGKAAAAVSLASGLAYAYLGIISKDAGVEVAAVRGGPPQAVASHETPDDPAAKAVVGK